MIGADDLVGVMTPEMSAGDVTFARKTTTIDGFLTRYWNWGERERINSIDPIEDQYRACYPGTVPPPPRLPERRRHLRRDDRSPPREADARRARGSRAVPGRRPRRAQGGSRHQRRMDAVRPDTSLARPLSVGPPTGPDVTVDPRTGKLSTTRRRESARHRRQPMRARPPAAVAHRRRPAVQGHPRRGESREHVVLSDRSARPRRVRHADCPRESDRL